MVIGIVSMTSIGFTTALSKAKTAATIIPVMTESMCTPGKMRDVIITAKALTISWARNFICFFLKDREFLKNTA
jgi:hypothetical protein